MTATILPLPETQFVDGNGVPYVGGNVYFYVPNTSTPKNTWQDPLQQNLNTNPIILDGAGRAVIYGSGQYRQVLTDSLGDIIWDKLTQDLTQVLQSSVAIWSGISTGTAAQQILTPASTITSYVTGQAFTYQAGFTNTGPLQLNISGVGFKNVIQDGNALIAGAIPQGAIAEVLYDGTNLQLVATSYTSTAPVPTGSIFNFAAATAPQGYLECNGAAISRTIYANLFTITGTIFGSGDGSTTFNVPDMRGYFVRGWDHGAGIDPARAFGSIQSDDFTSHTHSITDPSHSHVYGGFGTVGSILVQGGDSIIGAETGNTNTSTTGIGINDTGGTETRPKNVALIFVIKV